MTTTNDQPTLEDRLARLRPDWVTDELRDAVREHDYDEQYCIGARFILDGAEHDLAAAKAKRDLLETVKHVTAVMVGRALVAEIPAPPAVVYVPEATDKAREALQAAMTVIPGPGTLSLELERAAYESWPEFWRGKAASPICLPAEQALLVSVRDFRSESTDNYHAVTSWGGPQVQADSIDALERAESLLKSLGEVSARGAALAEAVTAANAQRVQMGIEWDSRPASIPNADTWASAELRALAKFRLQRQAVPV